MTFPHRRETRAGARIRRCAHARRGHGVAAVRIDSGDLATQARSARTALDAHDCREVRIVLSGNLDEQCDRVALHDEPSPGEPLLSEMLRQGVRCAPSSPLSAIRVHGRALSATTNNAAGANS